MKSSVKHVELLDHIRCIAIITVLLVHTLGTTFGYDELPWKGWIRDFSVPVSFLCFLPVSVGAAGVAIFFVVSGFCIHMSFQQQGQNWGGFFIRRIFRIYPAYLTALVLFTLFNREHSLWMPLNPEDWKQLWTHLFLIHNFDASTFMGIAGAFWSLAIEAQLYLLYPALLALVARLGWRRTLVVLAGCELLIRGTDGLMQTAGAADTIGGHISAGFARSPLGFWFSWALGACIADGFFKKQKLPFLKTSPAWWLALAIVCYFIKPLVPFRFLLFALATAAFTSRLLTGAKPKVSAPSFSLDILKKIGLWSYSIYLLHQPLLNIYSYIIVWAVPDEYRSAPITFFLILATWLIVIPLSILWYRLFELPGIALGKRIIQRAGIRHEAKAVPRNGQVWMVTGRYGLMIGMLLILVFGSILVVAKFIPREPTENNNLAWLFATSPEAAKRNGALAVKLAEDACQQTQYLQTTMVGTLAAAYAEAGRFDDAIVVGQKACALAEKNGETNLLQKNRELLELFQMHQPYREHQVKANQ